MLSILTNETAGPIARKELEARANDALAESRAAAKLESELIIATAAKSCEQLEDHAMDNKSMVSVDEWAVEMEAFLPRIGDLINKGTIVDGPAFAWKSLMEVTEYSIYEWDGGNASVMDDHSESDWFHEKVDEMMLEICEVQKNAGNEAWFLQSDKKAEITLLQNRAHTLRNGRCTYRYQSILKFLKECD